MVTKRKYKIKLNYCFLKIQFFNMSSNSKLEKVGAENRRIVYAVIFIIYFHTRQPQYIAAWKYDNILFLHTFQLSF